MPHEESLSDPLNPLRFELRVGQEAIDEGLRQNGIVPNDTIRNMVVAKLKERAWASVEEAILEVKAALERHN